MSELMVPIGNNWVTVREAVNQFRGTGEQSVHLKVNGTLSRAERDAYFRMKDSKFWLVKNRGGTGERYRCGNHSYTLGITAPVYHEYFTCMCIDRPWRGLDGALWAYASITRDDRLAGQVVKWAPNIARDHPESFGHVATELDDPDEDLIAVALGTVEPISVLRAQQLTERINAQRPKAPFRA